MNTAGSVMEYLVNVLTISFPHILLDDINVMDVLY